MAAYLDLDIEQGATWARILPVVDDDTGAPIDLTGYTARMQVRRSQADSIVLLELTTDNGGLIIDALNGAVTMVMGAGDTAAITWQRAVFDLELSKHGDVVRLAEGTLTVRPEVTR